MRCTKPSLRKLSLIFAASIALGCSVPSVALPGQAGSEPDNEVFSPDAFVEGEDDQGCGGDRGDGSGIEGDVLEGLEVLDQGVGPLGGSPH